MQFRIHEFRVIFITIAILSNLKFRSIRSVGAGSALPWHPPILANQLILYQPVGADYAQFITNWQPWIFRPSYGPVIERGKNDTLGFKMFGPGGLFMK